MHQAPALYSNIDPYVQALSRCAQDKAGNVRKLVCNAFLMMLECRPDMLLPQLDGIASFIMQSMQDEEENVALEASEFWLTFAEREDLREYLQPCLASYVAQVTNALN